MKKNLPKNELKDKLDSLDYEFVEAHWDNLASQLHADAGAIPPDKEDNGYKAFFWFTLLALLLSFVATGMFYYTMEEDKEATVKKEQVAETNKTQEPVGLAKEQNEALTSEKDLLKAKEENLTNGKTKKQASTPTQNQVPKNFAPNSKEPATKVFETNNAIVDSKTEIAESQTVSWPLTEKEATSEPIQNTNSSAISAEEIIGQAHVTITEVDPIAKGDLLPLPEPKKEFAALFAVPDPLGEKPVRDTRFGILPGFNFSDGTPGLTFGVVFERKLTTQWFAELGMTFRSSYIKPWKIEEVHQVDNPNSTINSISLLRYIDFPLLAKWKPSAKFSCHTGPRIGLLGTAKGRSKIQSLISDDPINPVFEEVIRNDEFSASRVIPLRSVELGWILGLTYHLDQNIGLGLRSNWGITPFSDPNIVDASPQKRNRDLQFLVQLYW